MKIRALRFHRLLFMLCAALFGLTGNLVAAGTWSLNTSTGTLTRSDGWKLTIAVTKNTTNFSITGATNSSSDYVLDDLPGSIDGYTLTSIESNAFKGVVKLDSVVIPDSVTSIGYRAFSGCSQLRSAKLGSSVRSIGYSAFYGTILTEIEIPDSVTTLGLASPSGVFTGIATLKTAKIGKGITTLTAHAFRGCTGLTSVELGENIEKIGNNAFADCTALRSVSLPEGLIYLEFSCFENCTKIESVVIPDRVISVEHKAFYGCERLASVTIGSRVQELGYLVFGKSVITEIVVPDSVTTLGLASPNGVFTGIATLKTAKIGKGVAKLSGYAFKGCTDLKTVILSSEVTEIAANVFSGCTLLRNLCFTGNMPDCTTVASSFTNCSGVTVYRPLNATGWGSSLFGFPVEIWSLPVLFNANGGSEPSPVLKTCYPGSTFSALPSTVSSGRTFAGWHTAPAGGEAVANGDDIPFEFYPLTLYAHWSGGSQTALTVTFDAQGGSVSPESVHYPLNAAYGDLPAATRTNYYLEGWYPNLFDKTGKVAAADSAGAQSHTLHANWWLGITFDAQGGTIDGEASKLVGCEPGKLLGSLPTPIRLGYSFKGWYSASSGGTQVTAATAPVAGCTIYAQWVGVNYDFVFYKPTAWGWNSDFFLNSTETATSGTTTFIQGDPIHTYYAFIENNKNAYMGVITNRVSLSGNGKNATHDFVYPSLAANVFSGCNGSAWSEMQDLAPGSYTLTITLNVNNTIAESNTANNVKTITFTVKAPSRVVTLTLDAQGGKISPATKTVTSGETYGTLPAPTRTGFTFDGWYTQPGGLGSLATASTTVSIATNHSLYAKWVGLPYSLTVKEGLANGQASQSVASGSSCTVVAATKAGMAFDKWVVAPATADLGASFDAKAAETTFVMPAVALTLTATFIESPGYVAVAVLPADAEGIQWSADGKTWSEPGTGALKAGKYTMTFRSLDARWIAPAKQSVAVVVGQTAQVTAVATRVNVVEVEVQGPGSVTMSPANGQLLPGKSVTLTAKADANAVFVGWGTDSEQAPEWSGDFLPMGPSFKISTNDPYEYPALVAHFRLKSECEAPVLEPRQEPIGIPMVGVVYEEELRVNASALPVKFTAKNLPAGLKFDSASCRITGVPTKAQTALVTVTATSVVYPKVSDSITFALEVLPLPASAQGVFNGYIRDHGGRIHGSFTLTASAAGKLTAKIVQAEGTLSYSAPAWDYFDDARHEGYPLTLFAELTSPKSARRLWVDISNSDNDFQWGLSGEFEDVTPPGSCGGLPAFFIDAQRNPFGIAKKDPDYERIMGELGRYMNTYTLALGAGEAIEEGRAQNTPAGFGYLTATVSNKGAVKLAGKLPDGTSLSASAPLVLLNEADEMCVPCFIPLYGAKKGSFGGMLAGNGDAVSGFGTWHYPGLAPTGKTIATEDRFTAEVELAGGIYYPKSQDLREYDGALFSAEDPGFGEYYPFNLALVSDAKGASLKQAFAGKAPMFDKAGGMYLYNNDNPCVATFAATKATGIFKGKFNLYQEYSDAKGALKLKTTSVAHEGILTPGSHGGKGFYLVPETWIDPETGKAYTLKRSFGVSVE